MSRAQAESVIKNIIREIAQECAGKGQAVSETLVAFMVKAVVLDPENEFNVDRTLTKDDVQKLIKICVERLMDSKSSSLDTVKMQVYFDMNYTTRSDFLEEHRRVLESRLLPVIREITDSRARTREELESLYRKIVSAVLLRSGLGSPTDIAVVREATAALQSVFPQTELGTFMSLVKKDKERQLHELTMIVTGIRLFNKECGKGGEGIDDLPAILNEAVPATTQNVDVEIQQTMTQAHRYTALIERIINGEIQEGPPMQMIKDALINARQHEAFLRIILHDVVRCAKQVEDLEAQLDNRMKQLQATVQSKTAVPTAQVYPQFIHLSQIWSGFQDEMVLLSVLSNILVSLEPFTRNHRDVFTEEALVPFLEGFHVRTDDDRMMETSGEEHRIDPEDESALAQDWLLSETTKNFNKLPLQLRGYCGWSIVHNDRLLLPGNPEIGLLRHKDNYYAFSSLQAAQDFAKQPDEYIQMVAEAAKKSPELIQLLELHTQFASITPYSQGKEASKMIEKPITKNEMGTQTDTHFYETNIVKTYEWNEWELRRKAIKLANLRQRLTKAAQTNLSNYRRDAAIQIWPPKERETQTKKDNYSNVPKPSVFLAGLRGCGIEQRTRMTKVDLTLAVDQRCERVINGTPKTMSPSGSEAEGMGAAVDAPRAKSPRGDALRPHKSLEHFRAQSPDVLSLRAHKSHDEEIHLRRSDDVINEERPLPPFLEEMSKSNLADIIKEHAHSTYGSVAGSMHSYIRESQQPSASGSQLLSNQGSKREVGSSQVQTSEVERGSGSRTDQPGSGSRVTQILGSGSRADQRGSGSRTDERSSRQSMPSSKPDVKSSTVAGKTSTGLEEPIADEED